jgi:hypothetical protein
MHEASCSFSKPHSTGLTLILLLRTYILCPCNLQDTHFHAQSCSLALERRFYSHSSGGGGGLLHVQSTFFILLRDEDPLLYHIGIEQGLWLFLLQRFGVVSDGD